MNNHSQAEKIKKAIGINYANKIVEYLKTKRIVSRNNTPYNAGYIRDLLNNPNRQNTDVENGIWQFIEELAVKKEQREQLLDQLLDETPSDEEE